MSDQTIILANNFNYRRGGAEAMLMQQVDLLHEQGFKTALMCSKHPNNHPSEWSDYFVQSTGWDEPGAPLSPSQAWRTLSYEQAYDNTRRLIDDTGACLLHAHNVYHHLSPSVLKAASDAGIPIVMTIHDYKLLCPAYSLLSAGSICEKCRGGQLHNAVRRKCMNQSTAHSSLVAIESALHRLTGAYSDRVDRFLSPSQFVIDKFVEWGWDRQKFDYLPNYVQTDRYPIASQAGDRLLYAGRLAPEKGVSMLIDAVASAGVGLDIVGTGPLAEELRSKANALGADVVFHGYQSGDALKEFISNCRAMVLPSMWYENAPVSILEAFACARPVIVARIGGMPEMVNDGQTGYIFELGDIDSLINCISRAFSATNEQIMHMGRQARQLVDRDFSQNGQADRLLKIYRKLGVSLDSDSRSRVAGFIGSGQSMHQTKEFAS